MNNSRLVTKTAKNGLPIFAIDGVHLASSYYPEKEAMKWALGHRKMIANSNVVILGLGCGYHANAIAELCQRRVLVVERSQKVITWYHQNSRQQFGHLSLHGLSDRSEEIRWNRIREQMRFPLVVLKNPFMLEEDRGFYHSLFEDLNGRTMNDLKKQLKFKAEQRAIMDCLFKEGGTNKALSINDVTEAIQKNDLDSREAELWLALGELVR